MKLIFALLFLATTISCTFQSKRSLKTIGSIEVLDPAVASILDTTATIEIIAEGHEWTEGPLWIADQKMLLYSDIPRNRIYQWTEANGVKIYLDSSGYTGKIPRGGETGSNGLLLNEYNRLVLCQHGNRQMAIMDADIKTPRPFFSTIVASYQGKKLNSPNDAVFRSNGDLFFTDPPYGLEYNMEDTLKELPFQGVYRVSNGQIKLLTDSITRPNGISLINNEKTLLVANSDPEKPFWYLFDLGKEDSLTNPRLLMDARSFQGKDVKGGPDGLKVDPNGNVFATGPGGVYVFNAAGKLLGRILVPEACSNVALTGDGKTLFITADMYVLKVRLRA